MQPILWRVFLGSFGGIRDYSVLFRIVLRLSNIEMEARARRHAANVAGVAAGPLGSQRERSEADRGNSLGP